MLQAKDLTIKYGADFYAVRDASLDVAAGEVKVLCGPNGAGKSTLLAALAGDLVPHHGQLLMNGTPLAAMSSKELAASRAVLEQFPTLSAAYTVEQLAGLSIAVEVSEEKARRTVVDCLQDVDLIAKAKDPVDKLSGGQKHRAHLARVLCQLTALDGPQGEEHTEEGTQGQYLLLDEPTSSLDLAHQIAVMKIARRAADRGMGVLIVLHDLNLAAAYSDQIVLMHQGQVVITGTPEETLTESCLTEVYETPLKVDINASQKIRVTPLYY
ncbi:ATP-binding cassette domain-containing protein [Rhodovibrionaceae bacterium A322]